MQPISTKITRLLGIKTPIISAPMASVTTPEFVAGVIEGGGFGFYGAALGTSAQLTSAITTTRTLISGFASQNPHEPLPLGIGQIGWLLDKTEISEDKRIPTTLSLCPKAIWFAFGSDLGPYIETVRSYDAQRSTAHRTLIFVIVNSVEDALKATNEWGVDVLVVQGIESGGHEGNYALPTSLLLTAVLDALPKQEDERPAVVAAGGIATGAQIASLLTLGADGVVCGTRFLFTKECGLSEEKKDVLVNVDMRPSATKRGLEFDVVNRTMGWPEGYDGRAIANKIVDDVVEGATEEERLRRFDEGKQRGEKDRMVIWAGAGAGMTREIMSVKDVVQQLHEETLAGLKRAAALFV